MSDDKNKEFEGGKEPAGLAESDKSDERGGEGAPQAEREGVIVHGEPGSGEDEGD